jgi:hypothetical protein
MVSREYCASSARQGAHGARPRGYQPQCKIVPISLACDRWAAFSAARGLVDLLNYSTNSDWFPHCPLRFRPAVNPFRHLVPPHDARLVLTLKTAKTFGLTIPPTLHFQADEVIR